MSWRWAGWLDRRAEKGRYAPQHIGGWHFVEWIEKDGGGWAGVMVTHRSLTTGEPCRAFVDFDRWTVEALAPLTLSPSIKCSQCGEHGFIRAGFWAS